MDRKRNWTFEDFHAKLDELDDDIRSKVLEIVDGLMESGQYTENGAIQEGIVQAEEWFYSLEG
ncbi:hypothetical protein [Maribacter sp. ACAM166]|uniref:hypothetical protein n=1 Tax=Maribacter sp. ACAM166 TaxID=2508996 RepID=UPI0010FDC6FA|nr:hypothetical protein [Maribacter sp. ACAM166]TLP74371.1 hypothetical protein ES765_16005 [Maribacter sp. ACAM166]